MNDDLNSDGGNPEATRELKTYASKMLRWYYGDIRSFLLAKAPQQIAAMDNDAERLHRLLGRPDDITVCFLGHSGIGKSTLLNSIAANETQILPSGGIGPLTAQATEVHYSDVRRFEVEYHKRPHLWQIGFALEGEVMRSAGVAEPPSEPSANISLDDSAQATVADEIESEDPTDNVLNTLKKQAAQLIGGNQFADRPLSYLVDGIRLACGYSTRWQAELAPDDAARVARIQNALSRAESNTLYERHAAENSDEFSKDLHDHAAGFLAPLINKIAVGWPSEVLQAGVRLVDLPGVGIAQDAYRRVTKSYIREKARAVILVVDRSGPTAEAVDLLRTSGYWDRLVGSADDPDADPCLLLIAVTKVDDVANDEYQNASTRPDGSKPKKRELYNALVERFKDQMRRQVADQLGAISTSTNESVSQAREAARDHILDALDIHPVSAPEFRRILRGDEDDRSFLTTQESTGVPGLRGRLTQLAKSERNQRLDQIVNVLERLRAEAVGELERVEAIWQERSHAAEETEKLTSDLATVISPMRKERDLRVGAFREFLDTTAQNRIRELVREAREVAEADVNLYLRSLSNAHWSTLRAAVRRGGTFFGARQINLPDDIASRFQEPTAAVWSVKLLKEVRSRTQDFASDQAELVKKLCDWAEGRTESTTTKIVRSQHARIQRRATQMQDVGKEAVADLRKLVKQTLFDAIEKPIRTACEQFVQNRHDVGAGVKDRIILLFADLAAKSTQAAALPASKILKENFLTVRSEIRKAFDDWGDPLEDTANLILKRYSEKLTADEASKGDVVLKSIYELRTTMPTSA